MTQLFVSLSLFLRRHRAFCWLSMVLLFVGFGYGASRLHLEEDIDKLMPSSRNDDGTTKLAFADLKIKDKTFLLFSRVPTAAPLHPLHPHHPQHPLHPLHPQPPLRPQPPHPQRKNSSHLLLAEVCDAFADSLQRDSALIEDIFYRLDDDLLPDVIDYLSAHLPAYIDTAAYAGFDTLLTREHFARQMQQNREDLTSELGEAYPELILTDPMGMRSVLARQLAPLLSGGSYQTVDGHFFVPDTTVCLAFLTPRFSATNTGQGSALFERLNTLIDEFGEAHPDVQISYHGTPASGYYNAQQIKHDLTTTIAGAMLLVLLLLLLCFRSWTTIPLLLLPVAFGTLFGLTMMRWLRGEFSLLALGIGGVVLGVAMSYVLHMLTHHRFVAGTTQLLRDQTRPVLLGCLTTIGSFAGLIFIDTALLQDFGLFAAFAILGTTLFSLVYLPQMLSNRPTPLDQRSLAQARKLPKGGMLGYLYKLQSTNYLTKHPSLREGLGGLFVSPCGDKCLKIC